MKHISIFFVLLAAATFSACEQNIEGYDNAKAYIYFNKPNIIDSYGRVTIDRVDSLYYSFAFDDPSVTTGIIEVPVNIIGLAAERDREYKVEVVTEKTTASDADWDRTSIDAPIIKSGSLNGVLQVKVNRTEITKTQWKQIVLRIVPNEDFGIGYQNLAEIKLSFSSIVAPPDWWGKWISYFGEYQREKFLKWKEIYYLGADPNVNQYGSGPGQNQPLYWDNMPSYPIESWFPSTFMFIRALKQYFIDNEVYPDGDTSKPRISLP